MINEVDEKKKADDTRKEQEKKREKDLKQAGEDIRKLATKRKPDSDEDVVEVASAKKRRKMPIVDLKSELDSDLKVIIEQDKLRQQNEAKRLELEERRLSLQEKQFECDAEERRDITDLLRALIENLNSKK